jgi:hypothetical protein
MVRKRSMAQAQAICARPQVIFPPRRLTAINVGGVCQYSSCQLSATTESYRRPVVDLCCWGIRIAVVDPLFCEFERVSFSVGSSLKSLCNFHGFNEDQLSIVDTNLWNESERLKSWPTGDLNLVKLVRCSIGVFPSWCIFGAV